MTDPFMRFIVAGTLVIAAPAFAVDIPKAATPKVETPSQESGVRLALAEEPITQVVALLEKYKGKTILCDPALPKTKISFRPQSVLSKKQAIVALESLLALNGVAITPLDDDFLKAVPAGLAASQDTPELHLESVVGLPNSQRVIARLFELRSMDAASMAERIKPFVSSRAVITIMREANSLLVTDSLANIIRLEDFIGKFDKAPVDKTFDLKNARATEVASKLKSLATGAYKGLLRGETGIDAIDRSNSVVVTTAPENLPLLEKLVAKLDGDASTGSRMEVFPIRNAEASKLVQVIKELTGNQRGATGAPASGGAVSATLAADDRFSGSVNIVADDRSNSLVAQGTPDDIAKLRKLVDRLDVVLPQVRIEATIVEVTLADNEASGLDTLGLGFKAATGASGAAESGDYRFNTATPALPTTGTAPFSISGSVKDLSIAAALNKSELRSRVKVLSSPTIVTTHNKKAVVNVSQSQPIVTGTTSDIQNPSATRSTVSYRDIGIKLEVTPRISDNGVIQMDVTQVVENIAGSTTIDGNSQPIIGKREATSYLMANDREVIVLAGLQSTADTVTEGKVWLLGDIPGLGYFFRPQTVQRERRELIIFLKPYVVDASKQAKEPKPGLRPDSLISPDANKFMETGLAPSPIKDTWAEKEKKREEEAARDKEQSPKREPIPGKGD